MQLIRWFMLLVLFFITHASRAQYIDPGATYHDMLGDRYIRMYYDNDFFTKMDYYYSQGIQLEYVDPALGNFIARKVLLALAGSTEKFGVFLNHSAYTPTSIAADEILADDRPYAATLSAGFFSIRVDRVHARRLYSALNLGVVGPWAMGEEMQTGIHRWLDNPLPMGWRHQIKNDLLLNYNVQYEQQIWRPGRALQLNAMGKVMAGTVRTNGGIGWSLMAGQFVNPYRTEPLPTCRRRWQYYLFASPSVQFVGYDAKLQGGLFNRRSPYTISASNIERVIFRTDAGISVSVNGIQLSYTQSIISREFTTGHYHRWGGFRLGVNF